MAKYLDETGLAHFWENVSSHIEEEVNKIDGKLEGLLSVKSIDNAAIRFRKAVTPYSDSLQGCTPFSFTNDYSYDSDSIYFGAVMGSDSNRRIDILGKNGNVLGSVAIPNGHYGCMTYDSNGHLYTLNYTEDAADKGKLFEIDVSDPAAPTISNTYTLSDAYEDAVYNFWHNGKMCIGIRSGTTVTFYDWNLEDSYEFVCSVQRHAYPTRGYSFAHYTYDATNDVIIWSGYNPNGILIYDMSGNIVQSVPIADILNFARVGEIEEVVCFDNKLWFGARTPADRNRTKHYVGFFYYDCAAGVQNHFLPDTSYQYNAHVNQIAAPYGTNDVFVSGTSGMVEPVFTFFEDAVNYFKYLHDNGFVSGNDRLYVHNSYPYQAYAHGLEDVSVAEDSTDGGSVPSLMMYNCKNVNVSSNLIRFDSATYQYNNIPTWLFCDYCDTVYVSDTNVNTDGYWNIVSIYSTLIATTMNSARIRSSSILYATTLANSTVEGNSKIFLKTSTDNTISSGVVFTGA